MDYEEVQLTEKQVAGLKIRTSNNDPQMIEKIGAIWKQFYGDGIEAALVGQEDEKCSQPGKTIEKRSRKLDRNTPRHGCHPALFLRNSASTGKQNPSLLGENAPTDRTNC